MDKANINFLKRVITFLFFVCLAGDIYAIATQNHTLESFFKPLLMPLLIGLYWVSSQKPNLWFIVALFFSFLGDVFLLSKEYFLLGLSSFLITHLLYIYIIFKKLKNKSFLEFAKCILPFIIYFSGILYLISDSLSDLFLPVLVYGTVISAFGMMSLTNYQQEKSKNNLLLLVGAVLFIISDSFIAINEFYYPHIALQEAIIIFYAISQYLISKSFL